MTKTVVGLFDTREHARDAVQGLMSLGIDRDNISLVTRRSEGEYTGDTTESEAAEGAASGAIGGGVLGGLLGLLIGVGALAIPGIGPIVLAGPLAAALGSGAAGAVVGAGVGAVSGGLLGALVGAGVPEDEAGYYSEGVRRGGTLVMATVTDTLSGTAQSTLRQYGAVDINERASTWREGGWEGYDANAGPYTGDSNWDESSKVGTATGTVAGAATGAALGSAGGPIGTVVGGVAGAVVGAGVGAAGDAAGESAEDAVDYDRDAEDPYRTRQVGGTTISSSATESYRREHSDTTAGGTMDISSGLPVTPGYDTPEMTGGTPITSGYPATSTRDYSAPPRRDTDPVGGPVEQKWEESSKLGTAGGTVAGAATGAAMGSVAGPVGTVVGGVAGGIVGAGVGAAGDVAGESAEDAMDDDIDSEDERRRRMGR